MLTVFLLLLVGGWIAWTYLADHRQTKEDRSRADEKVAMRQAMLARSPDSPAALEGLGDALRQANRPNEAVACYQKAIDLEAAGAAQGSPTVLGMDASAGLDNKLRLTRDEAARGGLPAYGETMTTRQQVCRRCGALSGPQDANCKDCGAQLAVDRLFDTLQHGDMRRDIARETAETVAMGLVVGIALFIASWMPLEIKGVLFISTMAVLAFRFLKRIGPG